MGGLRHRASIVGTCQETSSAHIPPVAPRRPLRYTVSRPNHHALSEAERNRAAAARRHRESGGTAKPQDLYSLVAAQFPDLSAEELTQTLESSPSTRKWWNMVQWVRQHLVELGELDGSTRGVWKITDAGRARLKREGHRPPSRGNRTATSTSATLPMRTVTR